ncbi:MAG: hypothetical protein FWD65_04020 [Coriobacteriia bacterium]|nr:hypothetical protein [Coriobacteriia bacterium]
MWKDLFSISWWRQALNNTSVVDINQRWNQIVTVFNNPRLDPVMFLMILAVIVVAVLIAVLTVVMIVSALSSRREHYALVDTKGKESKLSSQDVKAVAVHAYRNSWRRYSVILTVIVGLFVLFVCVGAGTSTSTYCKACHGHDQKVIAMQSGSHAKVSCVKCHEGGGIMARYTVNSFQRIGHLLTGFTAKSQPTGYSAAPSTSCLNCHDKTLSGRIVSNNIGANSIAVSHRELTDAGMQCGRCHNVAAKNMTAQSGTMDTCLMCHDGKQASDSCTTCHVNTPQQTIVSSGASSQNADRLVGADPKSQCYTCHTNPTSCDNCHGIRLPHPSGFTDSHPAAVLKYGLSTCTRCHNDKDTSAGESAGGAMPCSQCHSYDSSNGRWDYQDYIDTKGGQIVSTTHQIYIEATGQYITVPDSAPSR